MKSATANAKDSASELFSEKVLEVKEGLGEMASLARDAAREKLGSLKDAGIKQATNVKQSVEDCVKNYPLATVAASIGIGALAFFLLRRRA